MQNKYRLQWTQVSGALVDHRSLLFYCLLMSVLYRSVTGSVTRLLVMQLSLAHKWESQITVIPKMSHYSYKILNKQYKEAVSHQPVATFWHNPFFLFFTGLFSELGVPPIEVWQMLISSMLIFTAKDNASLSQTTSPAGTETIHTASNHTRSCCQMCQQGGSLL